MHVYVHKSPQERLALRKAEKLAQSGETFGYYVEEAKRITENEIKKSDYRRYVSESGIHNDLTTPLAETLLDKYLDEMFENAGIFGALGINSNFLNFLSKSSFKSTEDELQAILSKQNAGDDKNPEE